MSKIDEAIELLENKLAYNGCTYAGQFSYEEHKHLFALLESAKAEPTGNGWDDIPEIAAMLKDEAEPEAGEFTKEFLHLLRLSWGSVGVEGRVRQFGLEACIRLLAQQQEIERLKAENKRLDRWHDYFAWEREMKKVEAKNVRLTAEKKRLLTPTDCETESGGILCIEQEDKILAQAERIARLEKGLAVATEWIGESSSDELAAQYDIKQALKGDTP